MVHGLSLPPVQMVETCNEHLQLRLAMSTMVHGLSLPPVQMVETSTAKAAEMALKLDAVHRWYVNGHTFGCLFR